MSLKRFTCFLSLPGLGGERLWGRCLEGEEDDAPPRQLTVVNPSGSVTELIAIAVSLVADVTKIFLGEQSAHLHFFQMGDLVESLK